MSTRSNTARLREPVRALQRLVAHLLVITVVFSAVTLLSLDPRVFVKAVHTLDAEIIERFLIEQLAVSVALWLSLWGTYALARPRRPRSSKRRVAVAPNRGTAMIETLLIIVPFLLLTSGLAQLAMINVAGLLSDLAAYQGARAAWLWHPEVRTGRLGASSSDQLFRARTAAALVLAPTAGTDYRVGRNFPRGSGPPFRRIRSGITASFRDGFGPITGEEEWLESSFNWDYFQENVHHAHHVDMYFSTAFDSRSFHLRSGRKCTQAWMSLEDFRVVDEDDRVGVHFTYRYGLVFPWFAYIFGRVETHGTRTGYYMPIEREFSFVKHPNFR